MPSALVHGNPAASAAGQAEQWQIKMPQIAAAVVSGVANLTEPQEQPPARGGLGDVITTQNSLKLSSQSGYG